MVRNFPFDLFLNDVLGPTDDTTEAEYLIQCFPHASPPFLGFFEVGISHVPSLMLPSYRIFARFQKRANNLTKMPAFERRIRPFFSRKSAAAGVCPLNGAARTISWPESSYRSPFRDTHPRCTNAGGTPNRWMRSRIAANSSRGTATSAIWNVTYLACRTALALILFTFSLCRLDAPVQKPPCRERGQPLSEPVRERSTRVKKRNEKSPCSSWFISNFNK